MVAGCACADGPHTSLHAQVQPSPHALPPTHAHFHAVQACARWRPCLWRSSGGRRALRRRRRQSRSLRRAGAGPTPPASSPSACAGARAAATVGKLPCLRQPCHVGDAAALVPQPCQQMPARGACNSRRPSAISPTCRRLPAPLQPRMGGGGCGGVRCAEHAPHGHRPARRRVRLLEQVRAAAAVVMPVRHKWQRVGRAAVRPLKLAHKL